MRAKDKLERGDPDTKVSEGILGYLLLTKSGLHEDEMKHVLGLTRGELKLSAVRRHLVELYPAGSSKPRRHGAHYADDGEEYYEDDAYYEEEEGEAYYEDETYDMPDETRSDHNEDYTEEQQEGSGEPDTQLDEATAG